MRTITLKRPPINGYELGLNKKELYVPVNQSMKGSKNFQVVWHNQFMVIGDWDKSSVHTETFDQRIPGRSGTYDVHYFLWKPTTQEALL